MGSLLGGAFSGGAGSIAESVVLALVFAMMGYWISARHRMARGVTPWRLPSFAWALICMVFQIFGLVVEILAELTTRSALPAPPSQPARQHLSAFNAAPGPATVDGEALPPHLAPPLADPRLAPPLGGRPGQPPDFGWYPDPLGRHGLRYFDGRCWGAQVLDDGVLANDPV